MTGEEVHLRVLKHLILVQIEMKRHLGRGAQFHPVSRSKRINKIVVDQMPCYYSSGVASQELQFLQAALEREVGVHCRVPLSGLEAPSQRPV